MTLISSTYSWGLDPKESSGYKEQRGYLKLLRWLEGNSPRSSLKGTNLELGWGRMWVLFGRCMRQVAGSECQGFHYVLYMSFPSWSIWVNDFPTVRTGIEEGKQG